MKMSRKFLLLCSLLLICAGISGMLVGCGGGGGGGGTNNTNPDPTQTANLQLNKSAYNFGNVTLGNTATLSVIITNTATENISIESLSLSEYINFALDPSECGSGPYSIAAGTSCTVNVTFSPQVAGSYSETFTIVSDDPVEPTATVTLTGEGKTITAYSAALNQVETDCSTNTVTAYVSVTDQEGFAVTDLTVDDFSIIEDIPTPIVPDLLDFADSTSSPLSVAILMDYSGSVYEVQNLNETIENSVSSFVQAMGAADQAEIIKFATKVQRIQNFTTDKELLDAAIYQVPVSIGSATALYDAIYQGIDDVSKTLTNRRAVLVLTDGRNDVLSSEHTLEDAIGLGKNFGVPVFTVGVGIDVNAEVLMQIASETGGKLYESPDTDRLQTIYSQLSKVLNNQYVLTYTSVGNGDNVTTFVRIRHDTTDGGTITSDSNALVYQSCIN